MSSIRINFDRKYIPLVAPFTAKADIRYYLVGIRVEAAGDREGVYIVACDGHRLTVAYDKTGTIEGDNGDGVIMKAPAQFISACKARSTQDLRVIAAGNRVSVAPGFDSEHKAEEIYVMPGDPWITGNFPKWRPILPCWADLKPGCASTLSSAYLADYLKLNGKDRFGNGLMFWQEKPESPVVIQHTSHAELVSVLMPKRTDAFDLERMRKKLPAIAKGKDKVTP
jgi:DNA polymerase III beta subunit, central domain